MGGLVIERRDCICIYTYMYIYFKYIYIDSATLTLEQVEALPASPSANVRCPWCFHHSVAIHVISTVYCRELRFDCSFK